MPAASAPRRPSPALKDELGSKSSEVAEGEVIVVSGDGSVQLGDGACVCACLTVRTMPAPLASATAKNAPSSPIYFF